MRASKISLNKAKKDKLFYFVANVIVYREIDRRCLILKRSENEVAHPGVWAAPGGKLEWKDLDIKYPSRMNGDVYDFEDIISSLLERELFEEAGIKMKKDIHFLNDMAFIRPDGVPAVLLKFVSKYKSGTVKLEEGSFSEFAWVNGTEINKYDCIDGLDREVRSAIQIFN